jgi:DNA invertase Pin-like site-specific DNA recombinase
VRPKLAGEQDGPKATPAVVYAAKSTADPHGSIPSQVADCLTAIEREGSALYGEPQRDEDVSGYSRSRGPGLEEAKRLALEAAERHGGAELWVQHSDRLARGDGLTADHLAEVFFYMRRHGVRLRSVQDDSNLEDAVRAVLIGERNTEDSRRKSEATRSGRRRSFERGDPLGGPVPDGYVLTRRFDKRGQRVSTYALDPERAPVLRFAFELAAANPLMGDAEVARRMNRAGHRTKAGKPWRRPRVQDLLTNPWYAGRVARGRSTPGAAVESSQGRHPALVEPGLFDAIQAARPTHEARGPGAGRPATRHALAGLARCARCGEGMRATTSSHRRKDGTSARHYVCRSYHESMGVCDQPRIDAEVVDRLVVSGLNGFFVDFDAWLASVTQVRDEQRAGLERAAAADRERLATLRRRERKLYARWLAAIDADDDARERLTLEALEDVAEECGRLQERVSTSESALEELEQPTPVDALLDFYNGLSEAVRGRLHRTELGSVNAGLRELFEGFELNTTAEGIQVLPHLRVEGMAFAAVFDARSRMGVLVYGGGEPSASEQVAKWYGAGVPAATWGSLMWGGSDDDPEIDDPADPNYWADENWAPLVEGDEFLVSILATGDERIVPPVNRLTALSESGPTGTRTG